MVFNINVPLITEAVISNKHSISLMAKLIENYLSNKQEIDLKSIITLFK